MAICSLEELMADACTNGFLCLDENTQAAIELQLLKAASGDESTLDELKEQACANGFYCQDEQQFNAVALQLLCNAEGGEAAINLVPEGSVYGDPVLFTLTGLTIGASYTLVWGANELGFNPPGMLTAGAGNSTIFTATATSGDFSGSAPGELVTAAVYAN